MSPAMSPEEFQAALDNGSIKSRGFHPETAGVLPSKEVRAQAAAQSVKSTQTPVAGFLEGFAQQIGGGFPQNEKTYDQSHTGSNSVGEVAGAAAYPVAGATLGALIGGIPTGGAGAIPGALAGGAIGNWLGMIPAAARTIKHHNDYGEPNTLTNSALPILGQAALNLVPVPAVGKLANPLLRNVVQAGAHTAVGYGSDVVSNGLGNLQNNKPFVDNNTFNPGFGTALGATFGVGSGAAKYGISKWAEGAQKARSLAAGQRYQFAPHDPSKLMDMQTGQLHPLSELSGQNQGMVFDPTSGNFVPSQETQALVAQQQTTQQEERQGAIRFLQDPNEIQLEKDQAFENNALDEAKTFQARIQHRQSREENRRLLDNTLREARGVPEQVGPTPEYQMDPDFITQYSNKRSQADRALQLREEEKELRKHAIRIEAEYRRGLINEAEAYRQKALYDAVALELKQKQAELNQAIRASAQNRTEHGTALVKRDQLPAVIDNQDHPLSPDRRLLTGSADGGPSNLLTGAPNPKLLTGDSGADFVVNSQEDVAKVGNSGSHPSRKFSSETRIAADAQAAADMASLEKQADFEKQMLERQATGSDNMPEKVVTQQTLRQQGALQAQARSEAPHLLNALKYGGAVINGKYKSFTPEEKQQLFEKLVANRQHLSQGEKALQQTDAFLRANGIDTAQLPSPRPAQPFGGASGGFGLSAWQVIKEYNKKYPTPKAAQVGSKKKLLNAISTVLNAGPHPKLAALLGYNLADAAKALGPKVENAVFLGQVDYDAIMYEHALPVQNAAKALGPNAGNDPAINTAIAKYFRQNTLFDIMTGRAQLPEGLPDSYKPITALMAKTLYQLPQEVGFVGRDSYWFGRKGGHKNSEDDMFQGLFNLEDNQAVTPKTKEGGVRDDSFLKQKTANTVVDPNANPIDEFMKHVDNAARVKGFAGVKVVQGPGGGLKTVARQDSLYARLTKAAKTGRLDEFTAKRVKILMGLIEGKSFVDGDHAGAPQDNVIRRVQANISAAVLEHRLGPILKNIPIILGATDIKPSTILEAAHDYFKDPSAIQLTQKLNVHSDQQRENFFSGVAKSYSPDSKGWDARIEGEKFLRTMTILATLKQEGVSYRDAFIGKTPEARAALTKAYRHVSYTQPGATNFSARGATANTATNMMLMFKQARLSEYEFVKLQIKTGNWKQLGRYMMVGTIWGGPASVFDQSTWHALRANGVLQKIENETGLPVQEYAQEAEEAGTTAGIPNLTSLAQSALDSMGLNVDARASMAAPSLPNLDDVGLNPSHDQGLSSVVNATRGEDKTGWAKLAGVAQSAGPIAGGFYGTKSTKGISTGAPTEARLLGAGVSMFSPPTQTYAKKQIPNNAVGEALRVVLSGNTDKVKARNLNGGSIVGGSSYSILKSNLKTLDLTNPAQRASAIKQIAKFTERYGTLLQQEKKYQGFSKKELQTAVAQSIEESLAKEANKKESK